MKKNLQRTITYFLFFIFLMAGKEAKGQWVTIPDTNFVNYLNSYFPSCMNGNQMDTTCAAVVNEVYVDCVGLNIHDINGIQYFDSLQTLHCSYNKITSISLLPSSLLYLECQNNFHISLSNLPGTLLTLDCGNDSLTTLPNLPNSLTILKCNNNQLTSLMGLPATLLEIECNENKITLLPSLPPTLQTLSCGANSLTSLPSLPASLKYLNCYNNQLTSLPSLPDSIINFYCGHNFITSVTTLPTQLQIFNCEANGLINLPNFPLALKYIYCNANQLTTLPSLPPSLLGLECQINQLTSLPLLPDSLRYLNCYHNLLTSLPALPDSLITLFCSRNQLSSLPALPSQLWYLDCVQNLLTALPTLPSTLSTLLCSWNQLTALPSLSNSLGRLWCSNNQLDSLPTLPPSIFDVFCTKNNLITIPDLPPSLLSLACDSNQLISLPDLPDTMSQLMIRDNPTLSCFPKYGMIDDLFWFNTGITCLPNAGYINNAYPPISNLPLCLSISGCDFYWNIFGKVYKDSITNCFLNVNEPLYKNIPVQLYTGGNQLQLFVTNNEGYYSFQTGLGNYEIKIDTTGLPFDVTCPVSGNYVSSLTANDSLDANLDFGLRCKTGYLDLIAQSIAPSEPLRPGVLRTIYLNAGDATLFYGVTCATGVSGTVEAILDGPVSYISPDTGALTPTTINGDTVTWTVNDFSLIHPSADFNIIIQVDSNAITHDTVCIQLNINPIAVDNIPSNNSVSNCFLIVNSFDPNAKEIYPAGFTDSSAHSFTFTIYFQNTGNAIAENIYILDTLDNNLDATTFQFLSSSHDVLTQLLPGNILRFNFPNINLPDSVSNEPASHGYVQFKINRKDTIYPGLFITNRAQIFFDLNPPVTTNDAYSVLDFECSDLLSISISDTAICENEIFTAINNVNFTFPIIYEWLIDSTIVSTTSSVSLSGLTVGGHQLILNASTVFCTVSQTKQIVVYPTVIIELGNDTVTCNQPVTLDAGPGNISYQWSNGETTQAIIANSTANYSVVVTDNNGCSNADTVNIIVNPLPTIELGNDTSTCNIPVTVDAGGGFSTYLWSSGETTQTIIANATANYSVVVTDSNGCLNADTISITVNALPAKPTITQNISLLTSSSAAGNQWLMNGSLIAGAINNTYNVTLTGWYSVMVTDSNGCNNLSDSIYMDLSGVSDVLGSQDGIRIVPNPAKDEFRVLGLEFRVGDVVTVTDALGKVVYRIKIGQAGSNLKVETSGFNPGVYFVNVKTNKFTAVLKVVKY